MKPKLLENIGLTKGEASVYLALTKIGPSTAGPLVKESKVAYSNIYDVLDRLIKKGLVSFILKSKTKYFQAVNPKELQTYLEKKEEKIKEQKKDLNNIIPQLIELQNTSTNQEAEIFQGIKGLKAAYEKLLTRCSKSTVDYFFYAHEDEYAEQSDRFYFSIQNLLKKFKGKGISNVKYKNTPYIKQAKYINIKFVNFPIPANIDIVKDKVLIISWKKPIIGVLIKSEGVAESLRNYHKTIWSSTN